MDLELNDKVVFIAGSTRGIGLAVARAFLREAAKVVITGRRPEGLDNAMASLLSEGGPGSLLPLRGDMTNPADIDRALAETAAAFGGIDAVVGNVGNGSLRGGWELSLDDWQTALNVNLLGSMALASAAMPYLIARRGSLSFVSSIVGCEAVNAPVTYSAAKAAIQSAMKNLSRLVGPHGVRVNAVAPGNVLFPGSSWEEKLNGRREFFEEYIRSEVPMKRFGRAEEVADAVVFLASARASFITGASLVVDGGQTRSF